MYNYNLIMIIIISRSRPTLQSARRGEKFWRGKPNETNFRSKNPKQRERPLGSEWNHKWGFDDQSQ